MGFQHRLRLFFLSIPGRPDRGGSLERSAVRGTGTISTNIEYLIQAEPGEKLVAAVSTMNDVKMSMSQFLHSKCHACYRSHECVIHHVALRQIHHKFALDAFHHLTAQLL